MERLCKVLVSSSAWAAQERKTLVRVDAASYLRGCVDKDMVVTEPEVPATPDVVDEESPEPAPYEPARWICPQRLALRQRQALSSCLAWRPGTYRQTASTAAGVCLRFATDADEIALELRLGEESQVARALLREVSEDDPARGINGVSAVCDGRALGSVDPVPVGHALTWTKDTEGMLLASFSLRDPAFDPGTLTLTIPGLGARHEVTIWLPCLRSCEVGDLWCDGTYIEALPERKTLVVLGDDQALGLGATGAQGTWAALLAEQLGLDLVNQSVASQVFQPTALPEAGAVPGEVTAVVIDLGSAYARERCGENEVARDVRASLSGIRRLWPQACVVAVTPAWDEDELQGAQRLSCWREVPQLIAQAARRVGVTCVDGHKLADAGSSALREGTSLLTPEAHEQIAARLAVAVQIARDEATREQGDLRDAALQVLAGAGVSAVPLAEMVRQGSGEVLFAHKGCVLVRSVNATQMLYAPNHELGRDVCALLCERRAIELWATDAGAGSGDPDDEPEDLASTLGKTLGLDRVEPQNLCVYEHVLPVPVDPARAAHIRQLDASYADGVIRLGGIDGLLTDAYVEQALEERYCLGAVVENTDGRGGVTPSLVGFVCADARGRMSLAEVRRGHRKEGWDVALEAALINSLLTQGIVPWVTVQPSRKAVLARLRKLGLTILPATDHCVLSATAYEEYPLVPEGRS